MSRGKSWADREGIKTGVFGETVNGIPIDERNRATVWEYRRAGIEVLQNILKTNYTSKGVRAVLFGVHDGPDVIKYAVFVKPGFLQDVEEEE